MIDHLARLYGSYVDGIVLIVHPSIEEDVQNHVARWTLPVSCVLQQTPTGMLDAIMLASGAVRLSDPREVWITWCDQIAVHPSTVRRLAQLTQQHRDSAVALPTIHRAAPYTHLQRDANGRIVRVLHRREGDAMPDEGESEMGLFALSARAYFDLLPQYARDVELGRGTGERNFVPFVAWVAAGQEVVTFPATEWIEAIGVNTPEDLELIERHLRTRQTDLA